MRKGGALRLFFRFCCLCRFLTPRSCRVNLPLTSPPQRLAGSLRPVRFRALAVRAAPTPSLNTPLARGPIGAADSEDLRPGRLAIRFDG